MCVWGPCLSWEVIPSHGSISPNSLEAPFWCRFGDGIYPMGVSRRGKLGLETCNTFSLLFLIALLPSSPPNSSAQVLLIVKQNIRAQRGHSLFKNEFSFVSRTLLARCTFHLLAFWEFLSWGCSCFCCGEVGREDGENVCEVGNAFVSPLSKLRNVLGSVTGVSFCWIYRSAHSSILDSKKIHCSPRLTSSMRP